MKNNSKKQPWYIAGLHFECCQCGDCCSGPEEGYIWITKLEMEMLADHLDITVEAVKKKYVKRVGLRYSIKEDPVTKDCIFLTGPEGARGCGIYKFRPNQCRTWPFWPDNLKSPHDWNCAATRCPGINKGQLHTFEQIEKKKKQKQWWND